jgi:hypothetical protein
MYKDLKSTGHLEHPGKYPPAKNLDAFGTYILLLR